MCISPSTLNNGVAVACLKCWQCRANRINDWVGRNIAEQKTAVAAHSITLTYGRDGHGNAEHVRSALLTYSDVQKYIRALRDDGYPLRYFVAGEYGSQKGRAHWHLMAYWLDGVPEHALGERFHEKHWQHGFSHWEEPDTAAVRYVCKYIQKDIGKDGRQGHVSMSKKPPLGTRYFDGLARRYVEQGLSPQEPYYGFAGVNDKEGRRIQFYLRGAPLDAFLAAFVTYWEQLRGGEYPHSDLLAEFEDRRCGFAPDLRLEPLARRLVYPWREPPSGKIQFSETRNAYFALQPDDTVLYWSYDDNGSRSWQDVVRTENHKPLPRQQGGTPADYRDASGR